MNAIADFSAAVAPNPAVRGDFDAFNPCGWGESGAVPIGILVAAKMRHIRNVRKLCTQPSSRT